MSNKVVCITGGYGRLGQEFAKAFMRNGDSVIITGRNSSKLKTVADELGCDSCEHDVVNEEHARNLKNYIERKYGKLDVLVNNAGIMRSRPVIRMEPKLFSEVVETNLMGAYNCIHTSLPLLRNSKNALIIIVSSTSGHRADAGSSAYSASKFGLVGFTEALRKEVRKMDIRVTTISPTTIYFDEDGKKSEGVGLHGIDIAETAVFVANTRSRVLFRDIEMWATNPEKISIHPN